jgi:hypothetical protein
MAAIRRYKMYAYPQGVSAGMGGLVRNAEFNDI